MLERDIEQKFVEAVKKAGGKAYKFVSPGNKGVPDRLVTFPGNRLGFVELKQQGRKPDDMQRRRIAELEKMGCYVAVLDRPGDIQTVIDDIQHVHPEDKLFSEMINKTPR